MKAPHSTIVAKPLKLKPPLMRLPGHWTMLWPWWCLLNTIPLQKDVAGLEYLHFFRPFKRCLCWPLIGIYSGYLAAKSWSLKYLLPLQDYNFSQKWNGPTNTFLFVFHKHFAAADSSGWMFLNVQRHRCFQVLFRKSLPWNITRLFIISSEATMVKNPGWFQILPPAPILVPFSQLEVWYLKFGVFHTFLRIFGEFHTFLDIFGVFHTFLHIFGVFHTFLYIFVVFHTFLHIFGVFHTSNPSCFRQQYLSAIPPVGAGEAKQWGWEITAAVSSWSLGGGSPLSPLSGNL